MREVACAGVNGTPVPGPRGVATPAAGPRSIPSVKSAKNERLLPPNPFAWNRFALDNLSIRTIIGFGPLVSAAERRQVEVARAATGRPRVRQLTCFEEV
jgi:hypothetical protein